MPFVKRPDKMLKDYLVWKRHRKLLNNYLIQKERYGNNRFILMILQVLVRIKMPIYTVKRIIEKYIIERILK